MITIKKILLFIVLLSTYSQFAQAINIQGIRDGVVHFKVEQQALNFTVSWNEAWHAKENKEAIYLQGPNGQLIEKLIIEKTNVKGSKTWVLPPSIEGSYRLEIPGYSFRKYQVNTDRKVPLVYEPVKHHFTLDTMVHQRWFFVKPAGHKVVLGSKFHGGTDELELICKSDVLLKVLKLDKGKKYFENDKLELALANESDICSVLLKGNGKTAFWMDGPYNYFSTSPDTWFLPQAKLLTANVKVGDAIGLSPKLGVAIPNAVPPSFVTKRIKPLQMQAMSSYLFSDSFNLTHKIRDYYASLGVSSDLAIVAKANRIAELKNPKPTINAAKVYFEKSQTIYPQSKYLALADEPNLNYATYSEFEKYFVDAATAIKANSKNAKIAIPASSRFFNAPTHLNASSRSGLEWAQKLIEKSPQLIDAIAWNEWLYRDLIHTSAIKDSINAAVKLVGLDNNGRPNKPLIIGQTNISSGLHLSPYEQNTFFAALWWTSTVIQASESGQLSAINYFHLVDEPAYPKGMFTEYPSIEYKPVAYAMMFLGQAWYDIVHQTTTNNIGLDVLALSNEEKNKLSVLMVNKSRHAIKVNIALTENNLKPYSVSMLSERGFQQNKLTNIDNLLIAPHHIVRIDYHE